MKVLVISLVTSPERRASVAQKLGARHIAFEFIDAVDGRLGLHPYLANYDEKRFVINRRRKAAKGELGCYASHLLAWEKCVELNEPVVVLEDDFEMTDGFEAGLAYLDQFTDKLAFVRLEPLEKKLVLTSHQNAQFKLVKQLNVGMCTTGYLVTPQGARQLLAHGTRIRMPIDLYLKYTLIHNQVMHALVPSIVYPTHADSIIGIDFRNLREKGALLALKRFAFKMTYALGNLTTNLVNGLTRF
ncbi:MAG: glycosyltransferase family 25 protein [Pseudomonadota bacterium]